MFGYVLVNKPELKIKEFDLYRSYYCGLCHTLKEGYGNVGRMTLNYDMTFLIMLLCDLYDVEDEVTETRCIVHPLQKHKERTNEASRYCAHMCMLLTYYKCLDDYKDEKKLSRGVMAKLLKAKCRKVWDMYPEKAEIVLSKLEELSRIEQSESCHVDDAARAFGELMAEIFVYKDDCWKDDLYKVGFYLGKFIYIFDAYEDVEKDLKSGSFNPFKDMYGADDFEKQVMDLLMLMIGECTDAFERLPLVENVEILRNILYSGVWTRWTHIKYSE